MNRFIRKVAILGSGVMGSRIACHFANVGCEVLLLDIVPNELNELEKSKGLTMSDAFVRNRIVHDAFQSTLKSSPAPLYLKEFAKRIQLGNFEDDLVKIKDCDWIIEVVVERLDIKHLILNKVDALRTPGTIVSSNTSGIPIHLMLEGKSEDFQAHFLGTHFFNPPRYLPLLELIPTAKTKPEVLTFCDDFGSKVLGKKTVICKDTPAFIANRVGVFSIMDMFKATKEFRFSVEEVDKLTGPVIGRPKSATFRTCDVVGNDTLALVAGGLKENCPNDEARAVFELPDFFQKMLENKMLGSKTKLGFYKQVKSEDGKKEIFVLNLDSLEYSLSKKVSFPSLEMTKNIESLPDRLKILLLGNDKVSKFYQRIFAGVFSYVSHRVPEISDNIYPIDDAIKAGFGWEMGPFETWDLIGFETGKKWVAEHGFTLSEWVGSQASDFQFYKRSEGKAYFYSLSSKKHEIVPSSINTLKLENFDENAVVWKSSDVTLTNIGDGVLNLAFHTKMNTIGGGVINGINKAIDIAEKDYKALVISNDGQNFSAEANVGMIFMMAIEQDYDELNFAVKAFQDTMMRARYSNIPVLVVPHNLALGGACELAMHADKVVAHAETYMGLVEFGVGLIPGGGGTKEFSKRLSDELKDGDIKLNRMRERFLTIGQAKVSTSAYEAFELGYLRKGIDEVVLSKDLLLQTAKEKALEIVDAGYVPPKRAKNVTVLGQEGLGLVYVGANSMKSGNYMSEHDQVISEKLGFVLCGGDLSENTTVSEQYLLDLERKAFVELCMQRKTLERLESLVKKGKILRN